MLCLLLCSVNSVVLFAVVFSKQCCFVLILLILWALFVHFISANVLPLLFKSVNIDD